MLEVDGGQGEAGGQILRTGLALAAVTGQPTRFTNLRANRPEPGLKAQHAAVTQAFARATGGKVEGATLGSRELTFEPGPLQGGELHVDIGTAGSIPLFLQALLPAMAAGQAFWRVTVTGGTDGKWAPSWDYFARVHVNTLERLGWRPKVKLQRRGFFPRGGGGAIVEAGPWTPKGFDLQPTGKPWRIGGRVALSNLPDHVGARIRTAALETLARSGQAPAEVDVVGNPALDPGVVVTLWADDGACLLGADALGEKGVPSEAVGQRVAESLLQELAHPGAVDIPGADQLMAYAALATARGGAPSGYAVREVSPHMRTNAAVIEQFLPVRIAFPTVGQGVQVRVAPR